MAGGILVDILSGGTLGVLGDAMFGAGFSGAVSDITAAATKSDLNDNDWGISLGVGAISGLVGFGVGAVVEKMGISAVEVADIAAMRVGGKFVMSAVKDVARSVAVDAVIQSTVGAGSGVSETMLINLAHHRNLEEGLGQSAEMGAALGPIGGRMSLFRCLLKTSFNNFLYSSGRQADEIGDQIHMEDRKSCSQIQDSTDQRKLL